MKKFILENKKLAFWIFLLPNLLLFGIYTFIPVFIGFYYSFTDFNGSGNPKIIGLKNYAKIFENFPNSMFFEKFSQTLSYVLLSVGGIFIISLAFAYLITMPLNKMRSTMRTIIYIPSIMSFVVIGVLWRWLMSDSFSILNQILEFFGQDSIKTLSDPTFAFYATVFVTIWARSGFYMIIFMGGLLNIPTTLYEAAQIDGASKIQQFKYITLPMLKSTSLIVIVLSITETFKSFPLISNLTGGGPASKTTYLVQYIYEQGIGARNYGYASAMSFILLIIIGFFALLSQFIGKDKKI